MWSKRTNLPWTDGTRMGIGPVFFESAERNGERTGGAAVVVKAGRLSRQPADRPDFVIVASIQPLVPSLADAEPDPFDPVLRPRREFADEGGQFRERPG